MWWYKIIGLLISVNVGLTNLTTSKKKAGFNHAGRLYKLEKTGHFLPQFQESSGLQYINHQVFTHNDSGGTSYLYLVNQSGTITDSIEIKDRINKDWEEITADDNNNIYIGDFGNNLNKRQDLNIIKFNGNSSEIINIRFADQKQFPPEKENMNFDCEAMFWSDNNLYLFSKNRGSKWVKAYKVPDIPGNYSVSPIDSIRLPHAITAADINSKHTEFVLLGYGMIYLFKWDGNPDHLFDLPYKAKGFVKGGQAEAITYVSSDSLLISNEKGKLFHLYKRKK